MKSVKIKNIKVQSEVAIGIIFLAAVFVATVVWMNGESISSSWTLGIIKHTVAPKSNPVNAKILFASMGERNIYKVQKDDNKWVVVMDNGQESQAYDSVSNPTFSPDGTQFAFSGTLADQATVVVNNTAQDQSYDNISQIIFSPNGKSVAYIATKGQESVIVINGKESKAYQEIAPLQTSTGATTYAVFSPDGTKVAYKVVDDTGAYIVINGQEGKKYTDVSDFTFSADGTQFAYEAKIGDEVITVVNNREIVDNSNNTPTTPPPTTGNTTGSTDSSNNNGSHNLYDHTKVNFDACQKGAGCNF